MSTQLQSRAIRVSRHSLSDIFHSTTETANVPSDGAVPIVFDRRHALARLGGLEDILQEVLQVMAAELPRMHSAIRETLNRRNAVELKRAAHTLKGTTSILGANDLTCRLKCVEEHALAEDFQAAAAELGEIDLQFGRLSSHLARELATA